MTPLRLLVVDDEPLARLRLRALVDDLQPLASVVGEAADAEAALRWLHTQSADALLLDIRMPGRSGLQLAAALQALAAPPAVVFVTAHADHALAAFDVQAVDYLTKPVRRDRLQAALLRLQQRLAPLHLQQRPLAPLHASGAAPGAAPVAAQAPVLVVHDRGRVLRLPLADVLYLKAESKYVTLRTASHSHLLDDALADLEQRLSALDAGFIRVHRNALVARHAVRALERRDDLRGDDVWAVRVAPSDEWLAVSRRQLTAVRQALVAGAA